MPGSPVAGVPGLVPGAVPGQPNDRTCPLCGKMLQSRGALARHMPVHTGERPFACQVCHKSFNRKGNLKRHMETLHGMNID